jgi:HAD superfamily phosphoserine phosphatase-like hydrolase
MNARPKVLIDFDGTITVEDSVDTILAAFALPEWRTHEHDWEQGRIGSADCMRRQAALLRATPRELDAFIECIVVDEAVRDLIDVCAKADVEIAIVSDGYDYVSERIRSRLRLPCTIVSGSLSPAAYDRWHFSCPHARADRRSSAVTCKCAQAHARTVILIGDGKSDFCVAERAEFVFAKGRLAQYCRQSRIDHMEFSSLRQVLEPLAELLYARSNPSDASMRNTA